MSAIDWSCLEFIVQIKRNIEFLADTGASEIIRECYNSLLADIVREFFLIVIQSVPLKGILVRETAALRFTLRNSHSV